jgi:ketosteroid isomerase-like protein
MHRQYLLLALTLALSLQPAMARPATSAEQEVRAAARAVVTAFERGDVAALAARIDPDYRGVGDGGAPIDAPRALQAAKQLFSASRARRLQVAVVGLQVAGDRATMIAREALEIIWNDSRPPVRRTLRQESVWRHGADGWRLVSERATSEKPG